MAGRAKVSSDEPARLERGALACTNVCDDIFLSIGVCDSTAGSGARSAALKPRVWISDWDSDNRCSEERLSIAMFPT